MTQIKLDDSTEFALDKIMHQHRQDIIACCDKGHDPLNCGCCAVIESETIHHLITVFLKGLIIDGSNKKG
ncbi:hypothetical protein ES708_05896 [subsurface metagenome]